MIFGAALNSITHDADEVLELEEGVEDLEDDGHDLEEGGEVLEEVPEGVAWPSSCWLAAESNVAIL